MLWLVQEAWNLHGDGRVADTPKFMDTDRWDLIAKAPAALSGSANDSLDEETAAAMLKALLAERFKLAAHMEERTMPAWTLLSVKPKMKRADPSERTKCFEGPMALTDKDLRDGNPVLGQA